MKKEHQKIWKMALPYLKKGKRKDFVLHTKEVLKAMNLLIKKESGDGETLIPSAILHDAGWSKVPIKLQKSKSEKDKLLALRSHIKFAPEIIQKILKKLKYPKNKIKDVVDIVVAHKFQNPRQHEKRMLIDADTLAEAFKKQFYNDVKSYGNSTEESYNYRIKNKFYTKTATVIFKKEMAKRKKEIFK